MAEIKLKTSTCVACGNHVIHDADDTFPKCGTCGYMFRATGFMADKPVLPESYRRRCDCGGGLVYNKTYQTGKGFVHDFTCEFCDTVHQFIGARV
jgi:hypothetical protein